MANIIQVILFIFTGIILTELAPTTTTMRGVYFVRLSAPKQNRNKTGGRSTAANAKKRTGPRALIEDTLERTLLGCATNVTKYDMSVEETMRVLRAIGSTFPLQRPQFNPENKCILDCTLKKLGVMKEDAVISSDVPFAKRFLAKIPNKSLQEMLTKKFDTCAEGAIVSIVSTDPCVKASNFIACFFITGMMIQTVQMIGKAIPGKYSKAKETYKTRKPYRQRTTLAPGTGGAAQGATQGAAQGAAVRSRLTADTRMVDTDFKAPSAGSFANTTAYPDSAWSNTSSTTDTR